VKEKNDSHDQVATCQSSSTDDKKVIGKNTDIERERLQRYGNNLEKSNDCNGDTELELNQESVNEINKIINCPICKKVFDASLGLTQINEHANSCIDNQTEDEHETKQANNTASNSSEKIESAGVNEDQQHPQSSLSILQDHLAAFEYQNRKHSNPDLEDEGFFFCQICQKDLSRMNSQRRTQHINKCCDKVESIDENSTIASDATVNNSTLSCPFCTIEMKSRKVIQLLFSLWLF